MTREPAHQAQRSSQQMLISILANTADGIVVVDEFAQIQEWNLAQVRITGITQPEALGEPLFEVLFRLTPPEKRTIGAYIKTKERISEFLLHGKASGLDGPVETEIVRTDGTRRVVENLYFPIRQNGEMRAGCITRDISERKGLENARLESVQTREEFLSRASHSLRSPLQGLLGNLEMLKSKEGLSDVEREAALERAVRSAHRLAGLIQGLTETAGFQTSVELDLEEVDIKRIIEDALEALKGLAAGKGVPVAYAPEAVARPVRADRSRLVQVLRGLLGNAIRASEAGSPVLVTSAAQVGEVTVQVIDHGPGIPSGSEPELFGQVLMPGEEGPGTGGPGLYLLKKIIEAHGGRMGVQSQLGVGSTFYFSLPAAGEG